MRRWTPKEFEFFSRLKSNTESKSNTGRQELHSKHCSSATPTPVSPSRFIASSDTHCLAQHKPLRRGSKSTTEQQQQFHPPSHATLQLDNSERAHASVTKSSLSVAWVSVLIEFALAPIYQQSVSKGEALCSAVEMLHQNRACRAASKAAFGTNPPFPRCPFSMLQTQLIISLNL